MVDYIEQFSNLAQTTLNGSVNSSATSIVVSSSAGFPSAAAAAKQFRIGIDQEIMLVTAASGNTWTVIRGYEGTTASSHSIGATVQHIFTAGMMQKMYMHSVGSFNHFEFFPQDVKNVADITADIQNGMLMAANEALVLSDKSLDDLLPRCCVDYYIPRNKGYISNTLVIPQFVRAHFIGKHIRYNSHSNFALPQTPTIIVPTGAHLAECNLLTNDGTGSQGSGIAVGKNWTLSAITAPAINQGGTGHAVGDILNFPNPNAETANDVYFGFQIIVTSISGGGATGPITGFSIYTPPGNLPNAGAYALPPNLQATQWTTANGYTDFVTGFGTFVPPLYPQIATTGSGTGFVLDTTNAWASDYENGTGGTQAQYNYGRLLIGDNDIGKIRVMGSGKSALAFDPTYGYQFGMYFGGGNYVVDDFVTDFMGCGLQLECTDFHMRHYNPVECLTPLQVGPGGGSFLIDQAVFDSCGSIGTIDSMQGLQIKGRAFFATGNEGRLTPGNGNPASLMAGINSASKKLCDINWDMTLENMGTTSGIAGISLANCLASEFHLDISNWNSETRAITDYLINQWGTFGSGIDPSVKLSGSFDDGGTQKYAFSNIFGGTIPNCHIDIWDATIPLSSLSNSVTISGTITPGDTVSLTFTNAAISGLPITKTYTVQSGDNAAAVASGLATIINADSTLHGTGSMTASAVSNVMTVTQTKIFAGNTVLTASYSVGATETATFAPTTGTLVASLYGGRVKEGGLYDLLISGAPITNLGLNKCPTGSSALDKTTGTKYTNTGTAAAPSWH